MKSWARRMYSGRLPVKVRACSAIAGTSETSTPHKTSKMTM